MGGDHVFEIVVRRVGAAAGVPVDVLGPDVDLCSLGLDDDAIGQVIAGIVGEIGSRMPTGSPRCAMDAVVDFAVRLSGDGVDRRGGDDVMQHLLLRAELDAR